MIAFSSMPTEDEDKLRRLAEATARELDGWQVESRSVRDYGHYVQIEGPGSATIGFYLDSRKKTAELRGIFPPDRHGKMYELPYNKQTPKINVSLNKTGAQVAADIERRLWPEYEKMLTEALRSHAEYAAYENTSLDLAKKLAKLVGAPIDARSPSDVRVNLYKSELLPEFTGDLKVSGDGVRLDRFYLTFEQAEAVLRALVKSR